MSRHYFQCEMRCEVSVTLGHDEAKGYFLEVKRIGAGPGHGFSLFLYSSTHDPYRSDDNLDYYREKLERLGLVVPESMFEAVKEDADHSSRSAQHFPDGRILEGVPHLK